MVELISQNPRKVLLRCWGKIPKVLTLNSFQPKRVEITKNINTSENANNNNPEEGATLKLTTADLQELVMKSIEEDREEVVVIDNDEIEWCLPRQQ